MGTPDFSVGTLRELAKAGHEIAGVIPVVFLLIGTVIWFKRRKQ